MKISTLVLLTFLFPLINCLGQSTTVQDDFEGNGTINTWAEDNCLLNIARSNPFPKDINTSPTVLEYHDVGGQWANIRFDITPYFELMNYHTFSFKIYVPSNGLTGNAPNQVSLKLQNKNLNEPWSTQSEIIQPIKLDDWQIVTFNFKTDDYINLDENSLPPTERFDFNRVLIQVNGENNDSHVLAYIDDFSYDGMLPTEPNFDYLVWSDEFNTDGPINIANWHHQTQLPAGGSWFNNEIQHYTDRTENAFVENGILKIVARKETYTDQGHTKQYTSARLNSKYAFTYGKVEIRAKLPSGIGTWPAIWMLGKNINEDGAFWDNVGFGTTSWPDCGEIDIMEHWGHNQNFVQSATHTPSSFGDTFNKGGQTIPTASSAFHVYTLQWTEEKLIFSVDDVIHFVYRPEVKNADTWPFDAEQYILLNIAILPNIASSFTESAMEIDYVRVYQNSPVLNTQTIWQEEVTYFPNPVDQELSIQLPSSVKKAVNFSLYSIDSRLIRTEKVTPNGNLLKLKNLGGLTPGTYLVEFNPEGQNHCIKFVKW